MWIFSDGDKTLAFEAGKPVNLEEFTHFSAEKLEELGENVSQAQKDDEKALANGAPKLTDFQNEDDYNKAYEAWQKGYNRNVAFWKETRGALTTARQIVEARNSGKPGKPFQEIPQFTIYNTTDADSLVQEVHAQFAGLDKIDNIIKKEQKLVESHARWRDSMIASYPRPDKYATAEEYAAAEQEWRAKFDAGAQTLELARAKVDEIIDPIVPEQADVAIAKIDRFRIRKYGEEKHEELKKDAVDCVHARQRHFHKKYGDINLYTAERDRLDQEIKDAQARGDSAEEAKLTAERDLMQRRIDDINSQESESNALNRSISNSEKRGNWSNMVTRERAFELFGKLFPNRQGRTFYSGVYRDNATTIAEPRGFENEVKDSFAFFDIMAKCYNTVSVSFNEPTEIIFHSFGSTGVLGDHGIYAHGNNHSYAARLRISTNFNVNGLYSSNTTSGRREFRDVFIHENTHGIVIGNLGTDRENGNVAWLKIQTGNSIHSVGSGSNIRYYVKPSAKEPALLWDDYGYRVYEEQQREFGVPGNADRYRATEVITTGMEALAGDPEAFLRGFPNHANLVLDNLKWLW